MAKNHERELALTLRKKGTSITDIAKKLNVSKSTISYWCRDIELSPTQIKILANKSKIKGVESFLKIAEEKRCLRKKSIEEAAKRAKSRLGKLSNRDIFCIGMGLYWGEGYKAGSQEFGFTNSDSRMVLFYIRWLRTVFGITRKNLILRVSINQIHKHRIGEVHQYWSKVTGIPYGQFTKPSLVRVTSIKKYTNPQKHYGTLRIKVRNGTTFRREVLGTIEEISNQITPNS